MDREPRQPGGQVRIEDVPAQEMARRATAVFSR